jgi:hypothetical protein
MKTQSVDTSFEAERIQIDLVRQATVSRRFALVRSLSQTTIQLARRAIRRAHPNDSETEVRLIFVAVHYGQELADRLRFQQTGEATMTAPDILAAVTPVVEAFEQIGIAYQIGGSVASSVYGLARATLDIDMVADLNFGQVRSLVERLQHEYYVDEEAVRDAVQRRSSFNLVHQRTALKVDVFLPKQRPYDHEAFRRARQNTLEETEIARQFSLASPEDVILNKIEWYAQGGRVSDRQWNDVLGVMKVQRDSLDLGYLRRWAKELGLSDLLDLALCEARINKA